MLSVDEIPLGGNAAMEAPSTLDPALSTLV